MNEEATYEAFVEWTESRESWSINDICRVFGVSTQTAAAWMSRLDARS